MNILSIDGSKIFHHLDLVAIRKSGVVGWEPYLFQVAEGGFIVTGSVPRLLKTGKNKGNRTWDRSQGKIVVVTESEISQQKNLYEKETGNCAQCFGEKEVFSSWKKDVGKKYKPCQACSATGKANYEQ